MMRQEVFFLVSPAHSHQNAESIYKFEMDIQRKIVVK